MFAFSPTFPGKNQDIVFFLIHFVNEKHFRDWEKLHLFASVDITA